MNTIENIMARRTYRGYFEEKPVPREDLIKIMEAGLAAPSGCNTQTTSLIAVDDPEMLKKMRSVMVSPMGKNAPAYICVLTQRLIVWKGMTFAVQDYSAAIENMLLAAVDMGYASAWLEGNLMDENAVGRKIADVLNVPGDYELVCLLPIGVPADIQPMPKKKPFEERAWFNSFPASK